MFPRNTLTFNPAGTAARTTLADFADVRDIQKELKVRGLTPTPPPMNPPPARVLHAHRSRRQPILIDQHVPSPKK